MPLFGMDKNGRIYEESSISDDGSGKRKEIQYSDQGSVVFGDLSPREIKARKIHQKKSHNRKLALIRAQKQKLIKARAKKIEASRKANAYKNILNKKKMAQLRKKNKIILEAQDQDSMGYEYSNIHGSPFEGFESEGQTVKSSFGYHDLESVQEFGGNTLLSGHDEGLGFKIKIKKPKFKLKKIIKSVGKLAAKTVTAPIKIASSVAKSVPIVKDVYKNVDKLTGGTLTSVEKINDLPNKAAEGKPISQAEIMSAAMTAVKVGAIVASGGSAASLVSAGAGMLKGGPLGKTAFGQNILTLAEVAGGAAAIHEIATAEAAKQAATQSSKELAKQAASEATKEVTKDVAKKTMAESVKEALKAKTFDTAKAAALKSIEKKTGIPANVIMAAYDTNKMDSSITAKAEAFSKKIGEDQLKKAGLGNTMTQAILSGNAEQLGVMIKDAPDLMADKAKREYEAQRVKVLEMSNIDKLKSKALAAVEKAKKDASNTEAIRAKLDEEIEKAKNFAVNPDKIKANLLLEAHNQTKKQLQSLLAKSLSSMVSSQQDALKTASQVEVETAKSVVRVAAAEEGRYIATSQFAHPMLFMNKRIKGEIA